MKLSRTLKIAVPTAFCTAVVAQAALASGEPKNTPPFSRLVPVRQSAQVAPSPSAIARTWISISGEAKNERPFTLPLDDALARFLSRHFSGATGRQSGEPKNQPPFTRHGNQGS